MRKRKNSDDEESSEMEMENEEKVEANESQSEDEMSEGEDEADELDISSSIGTENSFLDSFYSLSSEDAKVRSTAAQTMLQHCLLGSGANSKDAAYAFRRLLNGVCSGRAAARQGNASALASFLKFAFHLGKMGDICEEDAQRVTESSSLLEYVRQRLLAATDPNQVTGKKKGSEERDYQFGRLFGILSIVRSNILISHSDAIESKAPNGVAAGLISDLAELFWFKRWMREPAAHGITTLLKSYCEEGSAADHKEIGKYLVEEVVIPRVLLATSNGDEGGTDYVSIVGSFCAEQLGIALFIQSALESFDLSYPLNRPVLSNNTVASLAQAMGETSVVVQPRTHFVWDSLWYYLSRPLKKPGKETRNASKVRIIRDKCPGGECNPREVLDLVMKEVVIQRLLRLDPECASSGKATHERRALALCIVKILVGAPFVSSFSGATRMVLEGEIIESSVLTPQIIRSLFLDVICAGSEKKRTSHLLKPLALDVLQEFSAGFVGFDDLNLSRRLSVAQALLSAEIRFDARTKTSTVADVLGLTRLIPEGNDSRMFSFWNRYLQFLQSAFLSTCAMTKEDESVSTATGFVELIYNFCKLVFRLETESNEGHKNLMQYKVSVAERVLKLFLAAAFFVCAGITESVGEVQKKKVKKAQQSSEYPIVFIAQQIKNTGVGGAGINYAVRSVLSARFFSLLAEYIGFVTHTNTDDTEGRVEKDSATLSILSNVCEDWKSLEEAGGKRYGSRAEETKEEDPIDPRQSLNDIHGLVQDVEDQEEDHRSEIKSSRKRCCTGIGVLAYSLYLHRLSCGEGDQDNDDPDADDENDEDEIVDALDGLRDVANDFLHYNGGETNPLFNLAELCANLLSSPIGSGNMGRAASPKLIREAVRFAWLGGLRLASTMASEERNLFDRSVVDVLLQAVGASHSGEPGQDGGASDDDNEHDDDSDGQSSSSSSDESTGGNVFIKAIETGEDPEDMQVEKSVREVEHSDLELDATNLQSMLEQDSDADPGEDVLEHHEGADAALAKLIKLKQESRKASQQAREKIEISHQLRCTFLLEILFGRSSSWNRVFGTENLFAMLIPLLRHRKKLESSLLKSTASTSSSRPGFTEKKSLVDRLSTLLVQKICKIKVGSLPLAGPIPAEDVHVYFFQVVAEARRADSKEQFACCSSCLTFLLRSTSGVEKSAEISSCFEGMVAEWSGKRTSKLHARLFDDLIVHLREQSPHLLAEPLIKASREARSPFLKCESFRLLTLLFSTKPSEPEAQKAGTEKLGEVWDSFLSSVMASFHDEEMRKAKRVRVVLKALEKFISCLPQIADPGILTKLENIKGSLVKLCKSESQGVTAICTKLVREVETKTAELARAIEEKAKDKEELSLAAGEWNVSKSSKKKKKKKKR